MNFLRALGLLSFGLFAAMLAAAADEDGTQFFEQGSRYFFGSDHTLADPRLGAYYFRRAAEAGHVRGQYNFGACCEHGWGVKASRQLAYKWYSRAGASGLPEAELARARLLAMGVPAEHTDAEDFPEIPADVPAALKVMRQLAASGFGPAAFELAKRLCAELPRQPEYGAEIRSLAQTAAARMPESPEALLLLATVYQNGIGGSYDMPKAFRLLERASEHSAEAKARLAEALEYGHGCEIDAEKSLRLDLEAAEAQVPRACLRVGRRCLYGHGVPVDYDRAFSCFQQAFAAAYPGSAEALGNCYRDGIGVARDVEQAATIYQLGANAGDAESQYELACCYRDGIGLERNAETAAYWFSQAAERHHAAAQRCLALALISGDGVPRNPAKAAELLQQAARAGDRQAAEILRANQLEF